MDSNLFKVVYTGRLIDGFDAETVVLQFAKKFKLNKAKASKVIKSGQPVVLKPKAEHVKAYQLKSALEAMGLEIKLAPAAVHVPKKSFEKAISPVINEAKTVADSDVTDGLNHQPLVEKGNNLENASWSLEPMAKDTPEDAIEETSNNLLLETTDAEVSQQYPPNTDIEDVVSQRSGRAVGDLVKVVLGWFVGILAAGFVLLKKFGLFKFLKVGGLMTTAAFAGYESEEICMGNSICENAIDNQIDDCWDQSGLDNHDWDNMSDEEYLILKPQIEEQFLACFVYENTGERVLFSPLELRFDLIDNCYMTENESCLELAEIQFNSCYEANEIASAVSAQTVDFYQAVSDHKKDFNNYYSCFLDSTGAPLFDVILDNWDELY